MKEKNMKNYLLTVIFLCSFNFVQASEITGTISTKMESSQNTESVVVFSEEKEIPTEVVQENQYIPRRKQVSVNAIKEKNVLELKVLGIEFYEDGSLLRNSNGQIYLLSGIRKKRILNLEELRAYAGEIIYDVESSVLDQYEERNYVAGELIRQNGTEKIFVIEDVGKRHVLNLLELKKDFFGQEIFNISESELKIY